MPHKRTKSDRKSRKKRAPTMDILGKTMDILGKTMDILGKRP
jgi:hypothetical protein